jgi:hypothetical protein
MHLCLIKFPGHNLFFSFVCTTPHALNFMSGQISHSIYNALLHKDSAILIDIMKVPCFVWKRLEMQYMVKWREHVFNANLYCS